MSLIPIPKKICSVQLILLCYNLITCIICQNETFDYIVVGSGSGGVVAGRLAEAKNNVLLIEAGPSDDTYSCEMSDSCWSLPYGNFVEGTPLLPLFASSVGGSWRVDDLEWIATTQPSIWDYNKTILSGEIPVNRAKMLGGCLSHNGQGWVRGSARDYDFVATNLSLPSWSFENIQKYYQKLEHYMGENKTLRGNNGPVGLMSRKIYPWDIGLKAFLE
eukprot:170530_1